MGRFYFFIAMKKTDWTSTANKVKLETNFPNLDINPTSVGATENNTKIEWVENILKTLFELSWVQETVEEFLTRKHLQPATLDNWEKVYISTDQYRAIDPISEFLFEYYADKYAYLRTPEFDIYWQVKVIGEWEMKTEKGIIENMPLVSINWHNIFFPVSAILTPEERQLFEMYKQYGWAISERDTLEKQIMELLIRLSTTTDSSDIVDSNKFMKEITDFCENAWTVQKLTFQNNKMTIEMGWRYAKDTDWRWENWVVLPPCELTIDIPNRRVRGWQCYHPHILSGWELCMGWTMTDMVNTALNNKSMKGLVECMVQFWNCYTSSDCGFNNTDRSPYGCLKRYINHCYEEWRDIVYDTLPVSFIDVCKTAIKSSNCFYNYLGWDFKRELRKFLVEEDWTEIVKYYKERHWLERTKLNFIRDIGNSDEQRAQLLEKYKDILSD